MASKDSQTPREESIARLIAAAGTGPSASAEARQRVYATVHRRWRETTGEAKVTADDRAEGSGKLLAFRRADRGTGAHTRLPGSRRRLLAVAAVIALAAVTLNWLNVDRLEPNGAIDLARFAKTEGNVELRRNGNDVLTQATAGTTAAVLDGDMLITGSDGRAALRLGDDLLLRANVDSRIRFVSDSELELMSGTIYIDSNGADRPLRVTTPFGPVEHVGTQYELLAGDADLRVRVREGIVSYGSQSDAIMAQAGQQLLIDTAGLASRSTIAADDAAWRWVAELATLPSADEYRLGDVLTWIAREHGLELAFAGIGTQNRIERQVLHGLDDLNPEQVLEIAARTADFDYEIGAGELLITP